MRFCVVTSLHSWFVPYARQLVDELRSLGTAELYCSHQDVPQGDIAFYLSYEAIVPTDALVRNNSNIVVHASALPQGKGMSPLTWQILEGNNSIPISLFEAVPELDAGPIYMVDVVQFTGSELLPELQAKLGEKIVAMAMHFSRQYPTILSQGVEQTGQSSVYRRRTPMDSKLDPDKSIAEQFELLRVVDNNRYPAFFDYRGRRYRLKIEVADE